MLPGAIGYASFLSYYLGLDYRNVIQKDWHGPLFMMLGLMIADGRPMRGGRVASALSARRRRWSSARRSSCSRRPWRSGSPRATIAPGRVGRPRGGGDDGRLAALVAAFTALGFLPLWLDGTWRDFLDCVRVVAYGGPYNQFTPGLMLRTMINQCADWHYVLIPGSILLAAAGSGVGPGASITTSLMALAGAWSTSRSAPSPGRT